MARRARMVIPGVAHHVTQRGNRRERIFLEDGDEQVYLDLLRRCPLMLSNIELALAVGDLLPVSWPPETRISGG